jgi:ArsR family transcriptional regulator
MMEQKLSEIFSQLSNPQKLKILFLLKESPMSVNEITSRMETVSQSSVSQHLKLLRWKGIVKSQRRGNRSYYSLTDKGNKVVDAVLEVAKVV